MRDIKRVDNKKISFLEENLKHLIVYDIINNKLEYSINLMAEKNQEDGNS